ncbi:hypothetical protein ACTS9T_03580 [Empedobacter falsenii]
MKNITIPFLIIFITSCTKNNSYETQIKSNNIDSVETFTDTIDNKLLNKTESNCNSLSYVEGWELGERVKLLSSKETCNDIIQQMKNSKGYENYNIDECYCIGFNDGKSGLNNDKYESLKNSDLNKNNINTKNQYTIEDIRDIKSNKKAKIDVSNYEDYLLNEGDIVDYYNNNEINFYNFYIIATTGCGTGCNYSYLIDTRNGKIYTIPTYKDEEGNGFLKFNKQSNILSAEYEQPGKQYNLIIKWKFNENNKTFTYIDKRIGVKYQN